MRTERLVLGSAVASIWGREPSQAMAAARTNAEVSGSRFVLGLGVNNPTSAAMRGLPYDRQVTAMRTYLRRLAETPYGAPPVVVPALQPRMLEVAAGHADLPHAPPRTPLAPAPHWGHAGCASSKRSSSRPIRSARYAYASYCPAPRRRTVHARRQGSPLPAVPAVSSTWPPSRRRTLGRSGAIQGDGRSCPGARDRPRREAHGPA